MKSDAPGGYSAAERLRKGTREDVRQALVATRERTLQLAQAYVDALGPDLSIPYDPGLNPPRWELGHQAWFQEWWVARNRQRDRGWRCDPDHDRAPPTLAGADAWFDSSRVAHRTRWDLPLPPVGELRHWLVATLGDTLALLDRLPARASADELYFFRLACLHEAMHAEAACYMARRLGFDAPGAQPAAVGTGELEVAGQDVVLGSQDKGFAFDNECPARRVRVQAFCIDAAPVSWDRIAAFADGGGYANARWWSAEGWLWAQRERGARPPLPRGAAAATHLSAFEADAWCRWAGRRLPTEPEWECAVLQPGFSWGQAWEWTASSFEPFDGFVPHPYRDYSAPWFGGRRVLKGACPATSPWLAHPKYRNFFEPHRSDIFAGFRSCADPGGLPGV